MLINVKVHVYSPDIPVGSADCTIYTPGIRTHSLQSHLLWGQFSICALCCSYSQSLQFSFLVPPGTHHCQVDWGSMIWETCPKPLHMDGSMTRAPVTDPNTIRARRCLTSVIWRELLPLGHGYVSALSFILPHSIGWKTNNCSKKHIQYVTISESPCSKPHYCTLACYVAVYLHVRLCRKWEHMVFHLWDYAWYEIVSINQ